MRDDNLAMGYAPSGAIFKGNAIQMPTLTAALDRIEETLAAAHERAEIAGMAVTRISIGDPMPAGQLRGGAQTQTGPSTVESRLHDITDGVDVLLGKLEVLAKRLNALV